MLQLRKGAGVDGLPHMLGKIEQPHAVLVGIAPRVHATHIPMASHAFPHCARHQAPDTIPHQSLRCSSQRKSGKRPGLVMSTGNAL